MKFIQANINNAAKLQTLSSIITKGNEAYKQALLIQKNTRKYLYNLVPVKIIFNNEEYTGETSIAVIAILIDVAPYNIYQKMRRNNGIFYMSDKNISIELNKSLHIERNNIDAFFKKFSV